MLVRVCHRPHRNDRLREIATRKRRLLREAGMVDPLLASSTAHSASATDSGSSSASSSSVSSTSGDSEDGTEDGTNLECVSCVCDHLHSPGAIQMQSRIGVSAEGLKLLRQRLLELSN